MVDDNAIRGREQSSGARDPSIGPNEGRELELMAAGSKPLSMFVEPIPPDAECLPEAEFDAMVAQGRLTKAVSTYIGTIREGSKHHFRRVFYALPGEECRINAFLLVQKVYDSLAPGWHPDLDRVIGLLLGYEE